MNPNHAELVRVTMRGPERTVRGQASAIGATAFQLNIVVEGRSGYVLGASGQPYTLSVVAFDFTAGGSPDSVANSFTQQRVEQFDVAHGWPDKVATFTVVLNDAAAVDGHLLKCFATLISPNQISSFVESPLFLLDLGHVHKDSKPHVAQVAADTRRPSRGSQTLYGYDEETRRPVDEALVAVDMQHFAAWLDAYSRAWETHDAQAIGSLFSEDVTYRYHSSDAPVRGREAIIASRLEEQDAPGTYEGRYESLVVDGDLAVAIGRTRYFGPDHSLQQEYCNCLVIRFDGAGRCTEFTKWYLKRR